MKALLAENFVITTLLGLSLVACSIKRENPYHESGAASEGQVPKGGDESHKDEPENHRHDEKELSDLDRPVSELFAATCEHNLKTYQCDECRYEVGVVKAEAGLFENGPLKKTRVEKHVVSHPVELTGRVGFDERRIVHVSTQVQGIIKQVHVTLGDRVKRGQALLSIESASLAEAQAAYLESGVMLALAERNFARVDALRKEGISSEKELLEAKKELEGAQIRKDAALNKLTRLGMSLSAAMKLNQKNAKGLLVLRSPVQGTVLDLHAVAGEVAMPETSLVTVGDNSWVWVWADLYERDIKRVIEAQERGQLKAAVEVEAFPGEEFIGLVDFVSPLMDESTRTVKMRINVPNQQKRLLAGMFAKVKVFIPGKQEVLAIPSEAVLEDEGRFFVFVHYKDDYYVRRPVVVGRSFAGLREIEKGLQENQLVVTNGAFLMKSDVLRSKMGAGCAD